MLQGSGELWPLDRVFAYQAAHPDALYLRAVDQVFYAYKYRGILLKRPTVLVAGSSRTMKFRAGMFGERARSFYNAGGLLNSVRDVADLADRMPDEPPPALLVLGVDLWWFNARVAPAYSLAAEIDKDPGRTFDEHVLALRWLAWNPSVFGRELMSTVAAPRKSLIGIEARETGNGFRSDGSHSSSLPVPDPHDDWRFVDRERPPIIERVSTATAGFLPTDGISEPRLRALEAALDRFAGRHVLVVGYLPPFSSAVLTALRTDPRHSRLWLDFERRVPELFRRRGLPVIDASDLTRFGIDDRVMIDGVHADETFHLYVVKSMLADGRVSAALPGADVAVARALASPRTNYWRADLGS